MTLVDEMRWKILKDEPIYVYACWLPPKKTNIIIKPGKKLDDSPAFRYQTFNIFPRIQKLPKLIKAVKKIEVKRDFDKENSVFAEFKAENKFLYKKCFEYDIKFSKLNRLIKEFDEVSNFYSR